MGVEVDLEVFEIKLLAFRMRFVLFECKFKHNGRIFWNTKSEPQFVGMR